MDSIVPHKPGMLYGMSGDGPLPRRVFLSHTSELVGQPSASDSRSTFLRTLPDAVSGKVSTKTHVVGVL
jgi:hypothetical protein